MNKKTAGHLLAFFAVFVWSTTLVSTKVLLEYLNPLEILLLRFIVGFIVLNIILPKRFGWLGIKNELLFAGAGFFGIFLYFMLDNYSLKYTMASNVGIIMSVTPFITAVLSWLILKEFFFTRYYIIGFILAFIGVFLISVNGSRLKLNPTGDFLALLGGVAWSLYSVILKKIGELKLPSIAVSRRVIMYGLLFMIPTFFIIEGGIAPAVLLNPRVIGNLLFLGLLASSLCFAAWTYAVEKIGVNGTVAYIYLGPFITLVASAIVLKERITPLAMAGILLTFSGLIISSRKVNK